MTAEQTLVFGVGAAKAGTTWLHRYFRRHPDVYARSIKELHFFDAYEFGEREYQLERLEERRKQVLSKVVGATTEQVGNLRSQLNDVEEMTTLLSRSEADLDGYWQYLTSGAQGHRAVVDLTPAYSLLSEARLRAMASMSTCVKFIYILRDPIERLWSQIRMKASRQGGALRETADRIFDQVCNGRDEQIVRRSDYAGSLERLKAAVEPENLLVQFYEEMFNNAAIERICRFLGIRDLPADFLSRFHAGPEARMNSAQVICARAVLADQYAYVQAQMGRLPDAWNKNYARA